MAVMGVCKGGGVVCFGAAVIGTFHKCVRAGEQGVDNEPDWEICAHR